MPSSPKLISYSVIGLAVIALAVPGGISAVAQTGKELQVTDEISPDAGPAGPSASRPPPPHVEPITIDGVTYVQWYGSDQASGVLEARKADGTVLWNLAVYPVLYTAEVERDGQEIFFRSMDVVDGKIRITNEMMRTYLVDPVTGVSTEVEKPPE